jgi:hypothetical protein
MRWTLTTRADPAARRIADRHYNRQSVGSKQFVPPGRCVVLRAPSAFWVTSWPFAEYVKHRWAGSWVCSAFRNENASDLSSELIVEAIAATRAQWPTALESCVTFVDRTQVKHKRDPGRCFRRAGFVDVGETEGGLVALALLPASMPPPIPAMRDQLSFEILPKGDHQWPTTTLLNP